MLRVVLWCCLALALMFPGIVRAQVGGATCAQAGVLTVDGEYPFDTTSATTGDPCFPGGRTAWFRFTAPTDGRVNANTCESDYNTYLTIFRGPDCPVSCTNIVTQNDDWCGDQSDVSFQVLEGQTYYFAINGPETTDFGGGELSFEFIGAKVGDDCTNALEIAGDGTYPYSNIGVSTDDPCRPVARTYWFVFTAPLNGEVLAETCGFDPNYDTFLSAYEGDCPTTCTGRLLFNDDACGTQSRITFAVEKEKTYRIAAAGFGSNSGNSSLLFVFTPVDDPALVGDVNDDGIINVADVTELARLIEAGNAPDVEIGDMNEDGAVNELDVQALANMIVN